MKKIIKVKCIDCQEEVEMYEGYTIEPLCDECLNNRLYPLDQMEKHYKKEMKK